MASIHGTYERAVRAAAGFLEFTAIADDPSVAPITLPYVQTLVDQEDDPNTLVFLKAAEEWLKNVVSEGTD